MNCDRDRSAATEAMLPTGSMRSLTSRRDQRWERKRMRRAAPVRDVRMANEWATMALWGRKRVQNKSQVLELGFGRFG